jgi:hypothetical protein
MKYATATGSPPIRMESLMVLQDCTHNFFFFLPDWTNQVMFLALWIFFALKQVLFKRLVEEGQKNNNLSIYSNYRLQTL